MKKVEVNNALTPEEKEALKIIKFLLNQLDSVESGEDFNEEDFKEEEASDE